MNTEQKENVTGGSVEEDFRELNIYLNDLYQQTEKDAGHLWIAFTDKFQAFQKRIIGHLKEAPQLPDLKELRERFFNECTEGVGSFDGGDYIIEKEPHEIFEWFKPYLQLPKEEEGFNKQLNGWVSLFKDEAEFLEYLKWRKPKEDTSIHQTKIL